MRLKNQRGSSKHRQQTQGYYVNFEEDLAVIFL